MRMFFLVPRFVLTSPVRCCDARELFRGHSAGFKKFIKFGAGQRRAIRWTLLRLRLKINNSINYTSTATKVKMKSFLL